MKNACVLVTELSTSTHRCAGARLLDPVSSDISDLRNFWLHAMCACTE